MFRLERSRFFFCAFDARPKCRGLVTAIIDIIHAMKLVAVIVLDVVKPLRAIVAIPPLPHALDSAGVPATALGLADLSLAAVLPPLFGGDSRMSQVSWGCGLIF